MVEEGVCRGRERRHGLDVGAQRASWEGDKPMSWLSELHVPKSQWHLLNFFSLKFQYYVEIARTPYPLLKNKHCTNLAQSFC